MMPARSKYRTAVHEAGHVVTALACGLLIDGATIDPEVAGPGAAGCVWLTPDNLDCKPLREFSDASLDRPSLDGRLLSSTAGALVYAKTINLFAGAAAERLIFSDQTDGDQNDVRAATFYANLFPDPETFLTRALVDAERILSVNRRQVEAVAAALLERKTLDAEEIEDVISLTPAMIAERARRRRWAVMTVNAGSFGKLEPLRM
jgi:ATP-dependent Zn protease